MTSTPDLEALLERLSNLVELCDWDKDESKYLELQQGLAEAIAALKGSRVELQRANDVFQYQIGNKRAECEVLRAERAALRAELEAAKKDAERYRWLRDSAIWADTARPVWCVQGDSADDCHPCEGEELDAVIDAALAAREGEEKP